MDVSILGVTEQAFQAAQATAILLAVDAGANEADIKVSGRVVFDRSTPQTLCRVSWLDDEKQRVYIETLVEPFGT